MAQTVACALDAVTHTSGDITVTATTPATIGAYGDTSAPPSGFQCQVNFKTPTGYTQYYTERDKPVNLTQDAPHFKLTGVGVYQVVKPATTGFNVGVTLDQ